MKNKRTKELINVLFAQDVTMFKLYNNMTVMFRNRYLIETVMLSYTYMLDIM